MCALQRGHTLSHFSFASVCAQDKINAFWEITKKDLDDKKAELRNKDREMEEMEERHQVEIKVYKQKVKHLLYEHQNNITTLKADGELALKLQQDEFRKREAELARDKRDLKMKLKEQVRKLVVLDLHGSLQTALQLSLCLGRGTCLEFVNHGYSKCGSDLSS
eukprot:scaffold21757_cov18-Tisochrysis_lutea.AAC.1